MSAKTGWIAHKRWAEESGAYLYVMVSEDQVKVGLTIDLKARASAVRYVSEKRVTVVYSRWVRAELAEALESHAQWLLSDFHAHGEWFNVEPEVAIEAVDEAVRTQADGAEMHRFTLRNQRPPRVHVPAWARSPMADVDAEDGSL